MPQDLGTAIVELDRDAVAGLVRAGLAAGEDPLEILAVCRQAMAEVGERFRQGDYYLSELLISAELFKQAAALLEPALAQGSGREPVARVVLATMRGDIHDLGKNIFATLLRAQAFEVHDLGVDVAPERLVAAVEEVQPTFVGFSSLITSSFESTRDAIARLEQKGLRTGRQILLGGGVTTPELKDYLRADFQTHDAVAGVAYCVDHVAVDAAETAP
jgi:methylmalonyl-CoA mutase cobalamin-binding domain/chain